MTISTNHKNKFLENRVKSSEYPEHSTLSFKRLGAFWKNSNDCPSFTLKRERKYALNLLLLINSVFIISLCILLYILHVLDNM